MKYIFVAFLISNFAFAQDNCDHDHHPELTDILELAKSIDWEAATPNNVKNAYCTRKTPFTDAEMTQWLQSNQSPHKVSKTINGINFVDESPENLETFRYLTTTLDYLNKAIPEKTQTYNSKCQKVDCALKEIFGNTSTQLQYMQRKYGMNGSHLVKDNASAWKKNELDSVLLSLSDFPEGILPVQQNRTLTHATRGYGNGNTIANAVITVYDIWGERTPEEQRSTITHELGHVLAKVTKLDDDPLWKNQAGWTTTTKMVDGVARTEDVATNMDTIVSIYGQTNSWEDLAESVVAFRYNPQLLKNASPEKYNLVKQFIFDNVEYTSESACQAPKRSSAEYASRVSQKMKDWTPSIEDLLRIISPCNRLAIETIASGGSTNLNTPEYQSCYEAALRAEGAYQIGQEIKDLPNAKFLEPTIRNAQVQLSPEKTADLLQSISSFHSEVIKNEFSRAFKDKFACDTRLLKYANQRFSSKTLGYKSYEYTTELVAINQKFCDSKLKPDEYVSRLFK